MKTISLMGVLCACSLLAVSCSRSGDPSRPKTAPTGDGKVKVDFTVKSTGNFVITNSRNFIPVADQFEILAFRRDQNNPGDYLFTERVDLSDMTVRQDDGHLTGSAYFQPGNYKFIANYKRGNANAVTGYWNTGDPLLTNKYMIHSDISNRLPEIFMGYDTGQANPTVDAGYFSGIGDYDIAANGAPNDVVALNLFRAVARLDIQLIHVTDNGTDDNPDYRESVYTSGDIFGGGADNIESIQLTLTKLNNRLSYAGTIPTGPGTMSGTTAIDDHENNVKIGNAAATTAVKGSFYDWDNVTPEVIGRGNAHIVGPYFMPVDPNAADKPTLSVTFRKKDDVEGVRIINVPGTIPLDRNKVTIVKIYVLGPDIWHTNVMFDVEVDQVWEDPNEIGDIVIN